MAKLSTIQSYPSIDEIKKHFGVLLPQPFDWRLMSPVLIGEINALPNSHGKAIATNGILVAIEQGKDRLFIGHLEYFVADTEQPSAEGVIAPSAKKTNSSKAKYDIEEFC